MRTVGFMECTFLGVTSVVNLCLIWLSLCAFLRPPHAQVPETGRLCLTFSCDWHFNEDFWNFRRAIHLMLGEDPAGGRRFRTVNGGNKEPLHNH